MGAIDLSYILPVAFREKEGDCFFSAKVPQERLSVAKTQQVSPFACAQLSQVT